MHAAIHLAPMLAAEKSKTAFYIAGGALVLWALVVSLAIGLRRPDFPSNLGGERAVIAITTVLVLAALSTAVVTSGTPAKAGEAKTAEPSSTQAGSAAPAAPQAAAPSTSSTAATPSTSTSTSTSTSAGAPSAATAAPVATKLALAANPGGQLSFDTKSLSAKAGTVTITFANASPLEHNVTLAQGSSVLGATPTFISGSHTLTLKLRPGTYTFYCSVPGHRAAGMEGTLKVS